ncbi:MAG: CNNM domain-containing protein [Paludibacteraceae bacterium]|nr:CNNM domain-containing protein [Paludibacteraceae bacterium]
MIMIFVYLFGALAISFMCSVLEAVLLSTPMSFITAKEQEGKKSATLLKNLKNSVDRPVGAILSLNTIAHTIGSAGVGAEVTRIWGDEWFGIASVVLTLLILIFSEIIPKTIGSNSWRSLALPSAGVIKFLIYITYPFVILSELITKLFSTKEKDNTVTVSREEVSAMVDMGTDEGVFKESESRIIKSCLKLSNVKAKEIMTPKIVLEMADESMSLKEFYDANDWRFSRIPIFKEDKDNVTGYVLKDIILEELSEDQFDIKLSEMKRPILTFSEDESVFTIWEKMLGMREHISIIVDEFGGLRGVVTMEDVLETMIGVEIVDEQDTTTDMQELAREVYQQRQTE